MAKVLVTGGSGFIGSHVVDALIAAGHEVTILDFHRQPHRNDVRYEDVDLLDFASVLEAAKGMEHIFHIAAVSNVNYAYKYPVYCTDLNVKGTVNVLEAARVQRVQRVYFASTVWVYNGSTEPEPIKEDTPFYLPSAGHIYTSTKIAAEMLFHNYAQLYQIPFTILRYGIPFGPRMREELLIPVFLKKAFLGQPLTITGDGTQYRNFVYVTDMGKAHVLAMAEQATNQVYNLEGAEKISVHRVAEAIQNLLGRDKVKIEYQPSRPGDFAGKVASSEKARRELGWSATTSFEDGLKVTTEYFKSKWRAQGSTA
jgi:UDP-glucose 4-epimerase